MEDEIINDEGLPSFEASDSRAEVQAKLKELVEKLGGGEKVHEFLTGGQQVVSKAISNAIMDTLMWYFYFFVGLIPLTAIGFFAYRLFQSLKEKERKKEEKKKLREAKKKK